MATSNMHFGKQMSVDLHVILVIAKCILEGKGFTTVFPGLILFKSHALCPLESCKRGPRGLYSISFKAALKDGRMV